VGKKESSSPLYAVIQDQQIVIPPWVSAKLGAEGIAVDRVRVKVRHLLQSLLDRGMKGDWVAVFANDAKLCRRSPPRNGSTEKWRTALLMGRKRPGDLSGIVFLRRCYDNVAPTPENELAAKQDGQPATSVELGIVVAKEDRRYMFKVFRFSEIIANEAFDQ
jgi:hypothetical protein